MSSEAVSYALADGVATVTLNRPETLNSMNDDLMNGLHAALQQVVEDQSVRVMVLTGAGRGFCSGADLSGPADEDEGAIQEQMGESIGASMDDVFHPPIRLLSQLPVPTVARINGVVAGGGMGLAMGCDIAIACRSARFVCTFGPRLGIVPDLGTTFHLTHKAGPARARGIAMLGGTISAEQAADWGLIWSVVDDNQLDSAVDEVTTSLARSSPEALHRIRQSFDRAEHNTLDEQLEVERNHQQILIPQNMAEGAAAFMEKREPQFDGRW